MVNGIKSKKENSNEIKSDDNDSLGFTKYFLLIPIWMFLFAVWQNYFMLAVNYPDSIVLYVGISITVLSLFISIVFIVKSRNMEHLNKQK